MQKATYETIMEFRANCPALGSVEPQRKKVKDSLMENQNKKSRRSKPPKHKCKGGKGCTRGMEGFDGKFHYIKFSRRQNVLCSCWK